MKTPAPHTIGSFVSIFFAALLLFPPTSYAQETISKEEYAKRQEGLIAAIAAMEAQEARARAADAELDSERAKQVEMEAERQRRLDAAPQFADDSTQIARAKRDIAAREARTRREAPAKIVAMLDPPKSPAGGVPIEGNGPAPGAKPIPQSEIDKARNKKGAEKKEVEILAQGGSTFNSKANLVVFDTDVVVKHPAFDLVCEKLIVFLKSAAEEGESALDKAIATGPRVTVQKIGEDGEVQIGQARKVTFEEKTGDVVLEDWPQVQTGNTLIQAKEQGTIIILNQNGKMKVNGPHITKLILPDKKAPVPAP